jgi:hypothetical protein
MYGGVDFSIKKLCCRFAYVIKLFCTGKRAFQRSFFIFISAGGSGLDKLNHGNKLLWLNCIWLHARLGVVRASQFGKSLFWNKLNIYIEHRTFLLKMILLCHVWIHTKYNQPAFTN